MGPWHGRRRETPVEEVRGTAGAVSGTTVADDRDRLWRACLALPAAERVAVVLRFYEDLDYARIADLTGVREGSARSRVSRGVARLRTMIGDDHE